MRADLSVMDIIETQRRFGKQPARGHISDEIAVLPVNRLLLELPAPFPWNLNILVCWACEHRAHVGVLIEADLGLPKDAAGKHVADQDAIVLIRRSQHPTPFSCSRVIVILISWATEDVMVTASVELLLRLRQDSTRKGVLDYHSTIL